MANTDPVRVGVLFSRAGTTSRVELSQLMGTFFAISEINDAGGINGRELVAVHYDPQCVTQNYRALAERLVQDDRINVVFGCYMSSTRKAVMPVIEKWQRLLMYPTPYEGFEYSPNIIYTGAAPNQNSAQLAEYMTRHFGRRVYLVGSDYIYPYESNRIMSDFILERPGGAKLAERYVRLDATDRDFLPVALDIKARQPDFVFSTVVGAGTLMLYQACADAGLDPLKIPIASLTTCEAELSEMSDEDRLLFLGEMGQTEPGLNRLIRAAFKLLGLQTYFTAGVKEVRAWTIHAGDTAPQAAGVIHTDFERGFIRAQTIAFDDFIAFKGEQGAKDHGKMRAEGKEYVVKDGDVLNFLFSPG